jgi:hypothetical protein
LGAGVDRQVAKGVDRDETALRLQIALVDRQRLEGVLDDLGRRREPSLDVPPVERTVLETFEGRSSSSASASVTASLLCIPASSSFACCRVSRRGRRRV